MQQAIMTSPGVIEFRDIASPTVGHGEVSIRTQRIGVCGSDVHVYHGRHPYTSFPVVQGHEFSGVVEAIGPGVRHVSIGAKVTALPQLTCGKCSPCMRGDYHICDTLKVQGFQAPGCAQELFLVPASNIVILPSNFTSEQGALVEPTAVAVHAVNRTANVANKNVVVLGAGPIGNLVAQVAKAEGADVLITDLSDFRLNVANECGFANTSNPNSESLADASKRVFGPAGFDVALECVGIEPTLTAAVESIGKGGTIVVLGVFAENVSVDIGLVQDRELSLLGTLMYQREDYERAIELIGSGQVATLPLETQHFAFCEYLAAYEFIERQGDKCMKVFIDF